MQPGAGSRRGGPGAVLVAADEDGRLTVAVGDEAAQELLAEGRDWLLGKMTRTCGIDRGVFRAPTYAPLV